jgi:predicted transcriptional regulator
MSRIKLPRTKNQTTKEIYQIVATTPNLALQDIANLTQLDKSTAFYHLHKLMYAGDVAKTERGHYISTRDKIFSKSNGQLVQELIIAKQEIKDLKILINQAKLLLTI